MSREQTFTEAICEATHQLMEEDDSVFVMGLGVDDPKAILGSTKGLLDAFGPDRIFDTPLSEDAMTGVAIGAALAGRRPIHVHIRMDFLMLAMNQLINVAAKNHYMYGGQQYVPIVIRAMIGKSWGQGAQHSQALHSFFAHVPGIKVVMPTTPYDAKGCLVEAVSDDNPVVFIEHRLLHYQKGPVPQKLYRLDQGKARVVVPGSDVTLIGLSYMAIECFRAQKYLESKGVKAEVIDPVWLVPFDLDTIIKSVEKTGHLCVVDNGWTTCGFGAEIISQVIEKLQYKLHIKVHRMGFASVTCPTTTPLEDLFYPNARTIASSVYRLLKPEQSSWIPKEREDLKSVEFKGPF